MARGRGCALRTVLAAIIWWTLADGVAIAQGAQEVTEDLGKSYLLARRTTPLGSIIETVLFGGQPVVTDIVVPADAEITAKTTRPVAPTPADSASGPARDAAAQVPPGIGSAFGGTWLSGEIIDDYLVLHRIRASVPVTHDIYRQGRKVGSITEVAPPIRAATSAGRNSFTFESTDDRFVVHLTQPDGTRIEATTEHGNFLDQVVERSAALAIPPRTAPQQTGSISVKESASPVALTPADAVPVPHPSVKGTLRTASPPPAEDLIRHAPEPMTGAPAVKPKPATTPGNCPPAAGATKPRPVAAASATAAARAAAKPVAEAPPSSASTARSVAPPSCYYPGTRVPPVWDSSRSMWVTPQGACH